MLRKVDNWIMRTNYEGRKFTTLRRFFRDEDHASMELYRLGSTLYLSYFKPGAIVPPDRRVTSIRAAEAETMERGFRRTE